LRFLSGSLGQKQGAMIQALVGIDERGINRTSCVIMRRDAEGLDKFFFTMQCRKMLDRSLNNLSVNEFEIFSDTAFILVVYLFFCLFVFRLQLVFGLMTDQGKWDITQISVYDTEYLSILGASFLTN
jgi:hypothetical protein